jgi:hypothetical protein
LSRGIVIQIGEPSDGHACSKSLVHLVKNIRQRIGFTSPPDRYHHVIGETPAVIAALIDQPTMLRSCSVLAQYTFRYRPIRVLVGTKPGGWRKGMGGRRWRRTNEPIRGWA